MQQGKGQLIAVAHLDFKITIPEVHANNQGRMKTKKDQLVCCTQFKDQKPNYEKPTVVLP